ncbi:hypothetical protein DFJ58DRAFT_734287 [Suillus subalutaceus]|uniref:uncharacterized protein n=1 Tax=Suillus subalutaceus TaxID=48586 RepID=UPI001B86F2B1|nr:uncharacterized protein DFJ58DRAFT_734287 [Suillus subalutaceus]KAG1837570.1 hypothetical protein DFJ58DRAFT_734287 [Suillus subalutaceus]
MSLPLLHFLQIPFDDIDFDNVVLSDPSLTESSSSPHLTASDDMLLDPTYWSSHPPRYRYLMQHISPLLPALETAGFHVCAHHLDWATDLFVNNTQATTTSLAADTGSMTEPESDIEVTLSIAVPAAQVTTAPLAADAGSTTEPESDVEITPSAATTTLADTGSTTKITPRPSAAITTPVDTGSTTEPESDIEITPRPSEVTTTPVDTGSTTEPESDIKIAPSAAASASATTIVPSHLDRWSFFATPSPPPPDSIYWKYVTREEDSKWYDRAGTDESFSDMCQWKQELQMSLDNK